VKNGLSKIVLVASCIVAVLSALATFLCVAGVLVPDQYDELHQQGGLFLIFFIWLAAPTLGALALLCAIPSGILFCRKRQRRDFLALCFSGGSFLVLLVQVLFWVLHH